MDQSQVVTTKKKHGCLKAFLIFILVLILLGVGGFIGIKAIVKKMAPEEVDYSKKDRVSFYEKTGIQDDEDKPSVEQILGGKFKASGSSRVEAIFTSEEVTAAIADTKGKKDIFENVNVRFVDEDQVEVFATISDEIGQLYEKVPELESLSFVFDRLVDTQLYYRGDVEYSQEQGFEFDVDALKIGLFKVPQNMVDEYQQEIEDLFNKTIENIEGFDIESLEITEDGLEFIGEVPSNLDYDAEGVLE